MSHIHDLYDFTVSAFIVHEGKILLLKHKKLNMWLQPGGHIELNETPIEALWREVEEETGLMQHNLQLVDMSPHTYTSDARFEHLPLPFDISNHQYGDTSHRHIDLSYLLTSTTDTILNNEAEADDIRWFTKQDLQSEPFLDAKVVENGLFTLRYVHER